MDADLLMSCVEVTVMVAVPAAADVKTPPLLTLPIVVGLTDHVTAVLKFPVPVTVEVQVEVCAVAMEVGEQVTDTVVIVEGLATVTVAEPDLVESCAEVAVIVAVPVAEEVKMPALLMLPMLVGLTDQVTALL